jgi:hypothetical protein
MGSQTVNTVSWVPAILPMPTAIKRRINALAPHTHLSIPWQKSTGLHRNMKMSVLFGIDSLFRLTVPPEGQECAKKST